jgi:hypothetical protein
MTNGFAPSTFGTSYNPYGNPTDFMGGFTPTVMTPYQTNVSSPIQGPYGQGVMTQATTLAGQALQGQRAIQGLNAAGTSLGLIPTTAEASAGTLSGASTALTGLEGGSASAASAAPAAGAGIAGYGAAAIGGYWGGAKVAEMLGGNQTGGSIGGAVGATAGMFFGPVGAIAGGVLGGAVGSMFGPKEPSDYTQAGGINLSTQSVVDRYAKQESSTGNKFNQQIATLRDQVQTGATSFTKWLTDNGATVKQDPNGKQKDMLFIIGGRDGFRTATLDNGWDKTKRIPVQQLPEYKNYGKDYKKYSNGIADDILSNYNITPELQAKYDEYKKSGQLDDIAAFGKTSQTYSGTDIIKATQRDTIIAGKTESTSTWDNFYTKYTNKYNSNKA